MMTNTIDTSKVLHRTTTWNDGETGHFASIDGGKMWLELDRAPTQDDRETIQALIDGTQDPETGMRSRPIMATRRYFGMGLPNFTVSDIREADDN